MRKRNEEAHGFGAIWDGEKRWYPVILGEDVGGEQQLVRFVGRLRPKRLAGRRHHEYPPHFGLMFSLQYYIQAIPKFVLINYRIYVMVLSPDWHVVYVVFEKSKSHGGRNTP